jgi:hypothetical protein
VGIAEHPVSGGIYSVENSADQITRMGVDVHQDNPAVCHHIVSLVCCYRC